MTPLRTQTTQNHSNRLILVVDDEFSVGQFIRIALERSGYLVKSVNDPNRALDLIRSNDFDLVVTDLKMPKLRGDQLYAAACQSKPEMQHRFVFLTGDTVSPFVRNFLQACGRPHLVKPVVLGDLQRMIADALKTP